MREQTHAAKASSAKVSSPEGSSAQAGGREHAPGAPGSSAQGQAAHDASVFDCAREQNPIKHRFTYQVSIIQGVLDIYGNEVVRQTLSDVQTVYVMTPMEHSGRLQDRIEVVVEAHPIDDQVKAFDDQNAWRTALRTKSVVVGQPFVIERHGDKWCFAGRKCPGEKHNDYALLKHLNHSAQLMMPLEKLQQAIDHKASDGTLSLKVSNLAELSEGNQSAGEVQARQSGQGFPAQFVVTTTVDAQRLVPMRQKGGVLKRSKHAVSAEATSQLTVDRQCRLRENSTQLVKSFELVPGEDSRIRITQTSAMRADPLSATALPMIAPVATVPTATAPTATAPTAPTVAPGAERKASDTRPGERECSMRANRGVFQQQHVNGAWRETEHCVCTGQVTFANPVLERAILERSHTTLPLSADRAREISELKVENVSIDSLEGLECLTELRTLHLSQNHISDLGPLSKLDRLETLNLYANDIRDLSPLATRTSLRTLSLSHNDVTDIAPLQNLKNLCRLDLSDNHILSLTPLSDHELLCSLHVDGNCISDLSPIARMSTLETLNASFNHITDAAPLRGLTHLKHLYLTGNQIRDLQPIAGLSELTMLFFESNDIREVSALTHLRTFEFLVLQHNPLDCKGQASALEALQQIAQSSRGNLGHDCMLSKRQLAARRKLDREWGFKPPEEHYRNRCSKGTPPAPGANKR